MRHDNYRHQTLQFHAKGGCKTRAPQRTNKIAPDLRLAFGAQNLNRENQHTLKPHQFKNRFLVVFCSEFIFPFSVHPAKQINK